MSDVKHTPGPWSVVPRHNHKGTRLLRVVGAAEYIRICPVNAGLNAEANARLIAAAPDHALLLSAMVAGRIRVEPLGSGVEICDGGLRYATSLDENGCPIVNSAIRAAITRASRAGGE